MSEPSDTAFDVAVERWVVHALYTGPASFDELLVALPGVYPTMVRAALDRLVTRDVLRADMVAHLRHPCRKEPRAALRPQPSVLPVPHPLDYDWRFTDDTVALLLSESRRLTHSEEPLMLLGVPRVFEVVATEGRQRAVLLDANAAIVTALQQAATPTTVDRVAIRCDVGRERLPAAQASVVITDPPWYREHMRIFLWAAARLCRIGGHVLLSFPSKGTRPNISQDREAALSWATQLGLELVWESPGALGYVSPPFERNALAAAGLDGLSETWRRSDLLVLGLRRRVDRGRPPAPPKDDWSEVAMSTIRIRFRADGSVGYGNPILRSLVPGDVLDSVSRRWTRREEVQVWTSTNRVFGCEATNVLREIVTAIAASVDPYRRVEGLAGRFLSDDERAEVAAAIRQIRQLLAAEYDDLARWGWPVAKLSGETSDAEPAA
jgi:hypothetical protein